MIHPYRVQDEDVPISMQAAGSVFALLLGALIFLWDVLFPDPLYVKDSIYRPQESCALDMCLMPTYYSAAQHNWTSKKMEKFSRILVVALKPNFYDQVKCTWRDHGSVRVNEVLYKINPNATLNMPLGDGYKIDFYNLVAKDARIAPLLFRRAWHDTPSLAVGPVQIYKLAEVLAEKAPFDPCGLVLNDKDPQATNKLLSDVIAHADTESALLNASSIEAYRAEAERREGAHLAYTFLYGSISIFAVSGVLMWREYMRRNTEVRPLPDDRIYREEYRRLGGNPSRTFPTFMD